MKPKPPKKPPPGKRKSSPEYMRWYRYAKKTGQDTSRVKITPAARREWRRKYQQAYRAKRKDATA